MITISILTPVLPRLAQFIGETAKSVQDAKMAAHAAGYHAEWIIAVDGQGDFPYPPEADKILRSPENAGVALSRNRALTACTGAWVCPLDADDLIDEQGFLQILEIVRSAPDAGWVGANRLLLDGTRTEYWQNAPRRWSAGELAEQWTFPFYFHCNSVVVRRDLALEIGGWPNMPNSEVLGFILPLSEIGSGIFSPSVLTRYRVWDGQSIADPTYLESKKKAYANIANLLNERRAKLARSPVNHPCPRVLFTHSVDAHAEPKPTRPPLLSNIALNAIPGSDCHL